MSEYMVSSETEKWSRVVFVSQFAARSFEGGFEKYVYIKLQTYLCYLTQAKRQTTAKE